MVGKGREWVERERKERGRRKEGKKYREGKKGERERKVREIWRNQKGKEK